MKEIINKYKGEILIVILLIGFLASSIFINDENVEEPETIDVKVSAWVDDSMSEEFTIVVLGQTTCGHCANYQPIFEGIIGDYNVNAHWIDIDVLNTSSYATLSGTYDLEDTFSGTPFTLLTYHGRIVDTLSGYVEASELEQFLTDNGVEKN